ncbi:MAG: ATP-binding protein [Candidatus Electryonea clarkiae]|nr:ATP-binding protein [Candidatus Electryonea clarkiae]
MNQVFMNLLMNAVVAVGDEGKISVKTSLDNSLLTISISDNGNGIEEEKLGTLFEPAFTERDSRIRMRTGLYSSHNIIRKHNGEIKVESILGKGTTFTVILPVNN